MGSTILPSSSTFLTMPVAFIAFRPFHKINPLKKLQRIIQIFLAYLILTFWQIKVKHFFQISFKLELKISSPWKSRWESATNVKISTFCGAV